VAHLGGGISVAALQGGRIIDVNDASSDGPFSPQRTGGLPLQSFLRLCFSGRFQERDIQNMVMGNGGLWAYLNTSSARIVEARIADGDYLAAEVYQAMIYQIAKEIAAMAAVLHGRVNAVVVTGGLAKSRMIVEWIENRVSFIAKVLRFPGGLEMDAMNAGVLRVMRGEEDAKVYN
jgi:butyrate kinase